MTKIPTRGGIATKGEAFTQILHHIGEIQSLAAVVGHLHNTEDSNKDKLMAKGWYGVSELMGRLRHQLIELAKGGYH